MRAKAGRPKCTKKQLEIFFGTIITVAAVYFSMTALDGLDPASILSANINWWLAAVSALIFAFSTLLRAFVYPYGIERDMSVIEAWQIVSIGNAANMLLPFKAGEGIRLTVFPKRYSAFNRARLVLIPGIVDFAFVLLLSIIAVYIADFKVAYYVAILKTACYSFIAVCALALIILLSIRKTRNAVMSYFNRDTLQMIKWVGLSWLTMLFSLWVGFLSFGYGPLRSVTLTFGAFAGMNIACLIPSSPGSIGIFEWSVIEGLSGLGISEIPAKTAGLILHVIQYAALLPLGIAMYIHFIIQRNKNRSYIFTHSSSRHAIAFKK